MCIDIYIHIDREIEKKKKKRLKRDIKKCSNIRRIK